MNQYYKFQWAPIRQPLLTRQKYIQGKLVCVFGFISVENGKIHFHIVQQNSFKKEDFIKCIKLVKKKFKWDDIVLFGDNARIHRNASAIEAANSEDVEIMFNLPYRPDLVGIEHVWRIAKDIYRKEIARLHVN